MHDKEFRVYLEYNENLETKITVKNIWEKLEKVLEKLHMSGRNHKKLFLYELILLLHSWKNFSNFQR